VVNRQFIVDEPNRLWITDITEHPTEEGKLYCAAVMVAYFRLIIGWSITNTARELVSISRGLLRHSRDGRRLLYYCAR
jgi:putative transposase